MKHQLKILTIPVFIEMALIMMLGAVDTVMLSRYSDILMRRWRSGKWRTKGLTGE